MPSKAHLNLLAWGEAVRPASSQPTPLSQPHALVSWLTEVDGRVLVHEVVEPRGGSSLP